MEHRFAISHASGLAAEAILEKLPESGIRPDSLVLLDDESRVGTKLAYASTYLGTVNQHEFDFSQCDVLLMPQFDEIVEQQALAQGCLLLSHVIERDGLPLFVGAALQQPEISYTETSQRLVGAELSCLLPTLLELDRLQPIAQLNITFMRSAEFFGKAGVDELASQTVDLLNSREVKPLIYQQQIAFNILTADVSPEMGSDLHYLLRNSALSTVQQTVNVPAFHGFAAAVQIRFEADVALEDCNRRLSSIENIVLTNEPISLISDCNQSFNCSIGSLHQGSNQPSMLQFWMMADPFRYGLANNYVNVLDFLLKSYL
jgi:aspartate-semialdehyde dehydrogenase